MGRLLWIEANIQDAIQLKLEQNVSFQVGLIVGQFSSAKDFAVHLVRTPDPVDDDAEIEVSNPADDEVISSSNNDSAKKSKLMHQIDDINSKWMTEHSRQVNRMLGGGISVVGVYLLCDTQSLPKYQTKMKSSLTSIHKKLEKNEYVSKSFPHSDRYFIHICSKSGKLTCRTCDMKSQATLKPVEFKYQSFLDNWCSIFTSIDLDIEIPIPLKNEFNAIEKKVNFAIRKEIEDIWNSYAVTDYKLIDEDASIFTQNKKAKKGKKLESDSVKIDLFKNLDDTQKENDDTSPEFIEINSTDSILKFVGSLQSKAFVHTKATFGEAILHLKVDIIKSILTRLELLCEEAQVNNLDRVEEWSLVSPVRVFTPFLSKLLLFSDYVFKDESQEDIIGRFSDLLNMKPVKEDLNYSEHSPDNLEVSIMLHSDKHSDLHSDIASELSTSCNEEPQNKKMYFAGLAAGVAAICAAILKIAWE